MNRSADRIAMMQELERKNSDTRLDMQERRQRRIEDGEPVAWDEPTVLRHIVKQFEPPTPAPQADDTEGALIDAVVEYVQSEVEPLRRQVAELRAELSVTRSLIASSNASWIDKLRAGRKAST